MLGRLNRMKGPFPPRALGLLPPRRFGRGYFETTRVWAAGLTQFEPSSIRHLPTLGI